MCTKNAIVTEKHIFPDKAALFLHLLSSFLTMTNTLSLIDGIVSNHTSLFLFVSLQPIPNTHKHIYSKRERVLTVSPRFSHSVYERQQGGNLSSASWSLKRPQRLYIKVRSDVNREWNRSHLN